ncbi:hypothetical protein CSOJ01_02960 [Colletotrichum sojae]|uniref:Uncharacterized protein n=1 Tax=Colletotrichum sojae TaxID=2175907 RepID=A0A8H6JQ09_9PEZI|nr:hypothetical protein CSOJ01_02960 [Colletotrichum sojae]
MRLARPKRTLRVAHCYGNELWGVMSLAQCMPLKGNSSHYDHEPHLHIPEQLWLMRPMDALRADFFKRSGTGKHMKHFAAHLQRHLRTERASPFSLALHPSQNPVAGLFAPPSSTANATPLTSPVADITPYRRLRRRDIRPKTDMIPTA